MKILLVNPPADNMLETEVPSILSEERGCNPPLGILYLASSLMESGHEVAVLDAQVEELDYAGVRERIRKTSPELVGLTAMSFTLIDCMLTAEAAKEVLDDVVVVFGGPHPTIYPRETAALSCVDYALQGEAEHTFAELVEALDAGKDPKDVPGLAYGETYTGPPSFIEDLDALPFPARKLTPYKKYTSLLAKRSPVTTLFSSRGCPYRCVFCDRPQMGKRFRARSAEDVVDEIEDCVSLGITEFLIYDDTFTVDRKRVLDICALIKERALCVGWDVRARVNTVDSELLGEMASAGCERIHYGVESGNQRILDLMCKGITLDEVRRAFKATHDAGIETLAYFMIGFKGDTRESIEETIAFAKELDPGYVHFSITTPFPATRLYEMGLGEGVIESDVWLEYAKNPSKDFLPPLWEKELSRDELISYLHKAYRSFYLRPTYVLKKIRRLKSFSELVRKARAGLKVAGL